jgi:hypothetical protein
MTLLKLNNNISFKILFFNDSDLSKEFTNTCYTIVILRNSQGALVNKIRFKRKSTIDNFIVILCS